MQVQFELTVGKNKFTLIENVESHADFFKKMSFYSTLPKVGPNGEEDLIVQHRRAQDKYDYYSIVCPSAKKEFKFGQSKTVGQLFAKGWEDLYQADGSEESGEEAGSSQGASVGLGAPAAAAAPASGLGASIGLGATKAATPTPAPAASAPAPAASPAVQNNAKNVLAKFGI